MRETKLGHLYQDGDILCSKGDVGNSMFLVQKGILDVILDDNESRVVNTIHSGEFFGEMSLFTGYPRSATIRSRGESRVMTIDESALMRRLKDDPTLAFRILQKMCDRLRALDLQNRKIQMNDQELEQA